MFDPRVYQKDFPILQRKIHGEKRLVYLDNAATSQKPLQVIDAISDYYKNHNANVHRGIHQLGDESTKAFHAARRTIAEFFGADPIEFIAVRNTTEAINQVVYTWGEANITPNDTILTTEMEHHSNIVPWQELAHRKQATVEYVQVTETGQLDISDLHHKLTTFKPKLFALAHVSNTLGTLNPVEEVVTLIQNLSPNTKILVDGAQAAPHLEIHFQKLNVDFYTVSAHKMLGPMGIGGLFIKKSLIQEMMPFLFGGGMINEVSLEETTFAEDLEERFTAGTPDVVGLIGWAAACEYLRAIGMKELLYHDQELVQYALEQLQHLPQIEIVGPTTPEQRVGSVAFLYDGVHAHDVSQILDSEGVAVRSGQHCTMPLHVKYDWGATTRASFQLYNTKEDIDALIQALKKVAQIFGK
jgi:cysteine desulfurase/selenocysteine lyase